MQRGNTLAWWVLQEALVPVWFSLLVFSGALVADAGGQAASDEPPPIDYLTAAQGAWLVSISFTGARTGPRRSQAFETYDGLGTPRAMLIQAERDAQLELVYDLPASTVFTRFAVPEVREVPSPSVSFFGEIEVMGSVTGDGDDFQPLARATLENHGRSGLITELDLVSTTPVRFVKLVLFGRLDDRDGPIGLQFSELVGNGTQDPVPLEQGFSGIWDMQLPDVERSTGLIELKQEGVAVTGCFGNRDITGTVSGNILRASGVGRFDGTPSQHVLLLDGSGALRGAASINNGPFGLFGGPVAASGSATDCSDVPEPVIGCGSTVYVQFEFNSAELRPESEPVLSDLHDGLQTVATEVVIEGHTSNEGSTEYNQDLSERRAGSVVEALVGRGLDRARISALGKGEIEPIASNDTELGRSLNRRVAVRCPE